MKVHRIAMWSGPRNISTAMMRAWENRTDSVVCDEPLYAHYLAATKPGHPISDEIVAREEGDWERVVAWLTGPPLAGPLPRAGRPAAPAALARVFYQKHMAHHLLPSIGREWLNELTHAFLIRDPREMLLSLVKITPRPKVEDTGLPQQLRLFEEIRARTGTTPPVLDAKDVLIEPAGMLAKLCELLGVEFQESMLTWPPGRRASDGTWAPHWYAAVEKSTGFQAWRPREGELSEELADVHDRALSYYEALFDQRVRL